MRALIVFQPFAEVSIRLLRYFSMSFPFLLFPLLLLLELRSLSCSRAFYF